MDHIKAMNIVDKYCFWQFPELDNLYSKDELTKASNGGSYIFHEDYFVPFILKSGKDEDVLRRCARYIEYLSSSENTLLNDLAEIAIIEGLVVNNYISITKYLGEKGRETLNRVLTHFDVNKKDWV